MGSVEDEVKQLIIDVLQLEDITPADIDADAPLFVDGLGLDSIDALELGVALHKRYGDIPVGRCGRGSSPLCIRACARRYDQQQSDEMRERI